MANLMGLQPTERLRALRIRSGLSMEALAKACGYTTASGLQRYEDPNLFKKRYLPLELIEKVAEAIEGKGDPPISPEEIYALAGVAPLPHGNRYTIAAKKPDIVHVPDATARYGGKDLPILGTVKGGADAYFFDNGAAMSQALTYRPVELFGISNAYAVYVYSDSMYPRYKNGEMVYVDPNRPPIAGDDVVIQMKNGEGFLKQLVRRTQRIIVCKQFNPEQEIEYPTETVVSIHLITSATRVRV